MLLPQKERLSGLVFKLDACGARDPEFDIRPRNLYKASVNIFYCFSTKTNNKEWQLEIRQKFTC